MYTTYDIYPEPYRSMIKAVDDATDLWIAAGEIRRVEELMEVHQYLVDRARERIEQEEKG